MQTERHKSNSNNSGSLVSILLISYNHAKYITAAIQSIYDQTYKNFELIVVDDGSTDESEEIIKSLQSKYGFVFARKANGGVASAINFAFTYARGDFIVFHASDDISLPTRLETQIKALETNDSVGYITGNLTYIDESGLPLSILYSKKTIGLTFDFDDFMNGRARSVMVTCMFRRIALRKVFPLREEIPAEDYQIFLRTTNSGYKCLVWEDDPIILYRVLKNSLGRSNRIKLIEGQAEFLKEFHAHKYYLRAQTLTSTLLYSASLRQDKIFSLGLIASKRVPLLTVLNPKNLILLAFPTMFISTVVNFTSRIKLKRDKILNRMKYDITKIERNY